MAAILVACSKVPITDRKQVNLLPESTLNDMARNQYRQFLTENKVVPATDADARMVQNVGNNIKSAVETYLKQNKMTDRIQGYNWEFNLIDNSDANAWAMPGGKVAIYTGILPLTQNETGLAVVMGHEIAHAIARHGNERMSQALLAQLGGIGLSVALNEKPKETQNIFLTAYGVGSTLGILKYSRTHESEADKLGLIFMAIAGYNPDEAVAFWERMAKHHSGPKPPEFVSTHPSDATRIKDIKAYLPQARKYYKPQITEAK